MNPLIEQLQNIVGVNGILAGADVAQRSDSWPPDGGCRAKVIVRPASTDEVSRVLRACHAAGQTVVTHGGVTGLADGAKTHPDDLVLSLERMNTVAPIDRANRCVTVEAGACLQTVQEAAEKAGLLFPVDFGARGSAQIGGAISTNAGGNSVIRYGMTREQVLGVEAVLANGTIISSMKDVLKNNTGYDLKQLFIGSEGTLGIVTRAILRLRPQPRSCNTALVAIEEFTQVAEFLQVMDGALGGTLSSFEVMWNDFFTSIIGDGSQHVAPVGLDFPFYVLVESTGGHQESDDLQFENAMSEAFESGLIADAVLAQSGQQRQELWAIRDDIENLFQILYPPIVFDVSLGIGGMGDYVEKVRRQLADRWPHFKMVTFGHIGDGNIHFGIGIGSVEPADVHAVEEVVYGGLEPYHGVISAEHGIGLHKKGYLHHSRSSDEIALMRTLKTSLDPANILNPGKIFEL